MWVQISLALTVSLVSFSIPTLHKRIHRKKPKQKDRHAVETYFLKPSNFICYKHQRNAICSDDCMFYHINNIVLNIYLAQDRVWVCVNHITLSPIAKALIEAYQKGIDVRVITDTVMINVKGSVVKRLANEGIPVYTNENTIGSSIMHQKYIITDESILFGSANYTWQAFGNNFEFYIFTNKKREVEDFSSNFSLLMEKFMRYTPKGGNTIGVK